MMIYVFGKPDFNFDEITCITADWKEAVKHAVDKEGFRWRTFEIKDPRTGGVATTESINHTVEQLRQMNDELSDENYRLRETIVQMAMEACGK